MSLASYFAYGFGTLGALFLILVTYVLYKFIIKPLSIMSFYKKQGFPCYFYPFLGSIKRGRVSEIKDNDSMSHYRNQAKQDPNLRVELFNFGTRVCLCLYDPKLIKDFYSKQSYYKKVQFPKGLLTLLGTGLVVAEDKLWKNHRKVISGMFHFEFLRDNTPLIINTTREFLNNLKQSSLKNVDIMDEIQKITGEVVGRTFFGENLNQYTMRGQPLTLYLANLITRIGGTFRIPFVFASAALGLDPEWVPAYKKIMEEVREFRQLCNKIIQDRKSSKTRTNNLLELLLETQNAANPEDRFSDEDIINEFVTFFVAGMDTTGHLVTMALYFLDRNPEYIKDVQKEVDQIYNKNDIPSIEAINQMEVTHAVLKESLRINTPAIIISPRLAQVDHELLDIKVKKGMSVRPTPLFNYSNTKYFDEPEKFKPERWLKKKEQDIDPFVFIPFSAGPRNCIGQHMSILESKIIMAEFLNMFRFKLVPDFKLTMTIRFLYESKEKICMDLEVKQ